MNTKKLMCALSVPIWLTACSALDARPGAPVTVGNGA